MFKTSWQLLFVDERLPERILTRPVTSKLESVSPLQITTQLHSC